MRLLELFSGTKSIGRSFQKRGWEVVSLDLTNEFNPTIQADILTWDYKSCYPPGYFMAIWASPCCTNYSRARTRGGPRDLVGADKLVQKTLEIIAYFNATYYYIENPMDRPSSTTRCGLLPPTTLQIRLLSIWSALPKSHSGME